MNSVEAQDRGSDVSSTFNPYLHGARGLFALMILLYHVVNSRLPTFAALSSGAGLFMGRSLEHGVELFFGISGIVIVGALRRAAGPQTFAIDRATRIYPVLWVAVTALVLMEAATHYAPALPSPLVFLANLLALPPLAPVPLLHPAAWSLSYEMAFYLTCALAWLLWKRAGGWSWLLVAPVCAWLLATHVRACLMPVGMLVAWQAPRLPERARGLFRGPGLGMIGFLVLYELVCRRGGGDLIDTGAGQLTGGLTPWLLLGAMACALYAFAGVLFGYGLFSGLLATPAFQFLGTISYSLYLWHPMVLSVVKSLGGALHLPERLGAASQLVFLAAVLPPSLLLGWLSAQTLEKRATPWLRRRLVGERRRPRALPAGSPVEARPSYPESPA